LRGEPLIPLSDVTFAEAAGRPNVGSGNGRKSSGSTIKNVERAATATR
jgi:hypothetical protein